MKRSIQLLLALFLLIIGGLFFTKYQLKKDYSAIDRTNPFYAFIEVSDLNFSHVNISGGNRLHLTIEPGDNNLYIDESNADGVSYNIGSDTLYISFDDNYTFDNDPYEYGWPNRNTSDVVIQSNALQSLIANDASIQMDLGSASNFKSKITGYSKLAILSQKNSLNALQIESHDQSKIRINKEGSLLAIKELGLNLNDQSIAEIYQTTFDSSIFQLDTNCRISGDALFFNQNRN